MSSSEKNSKPGSPYFRCKVCNLSFNDKNHVYSKKHRDSLRKVLQKFHVKVKEAKTFIKCPAIQEKDFDTGAKWWCYCCDCEVPKHNYQDDVIVCYLGMLNHLQSVAHLKKIRRYWWKNRVKEAKIEDYLVTTEDYKEFRNNTSKAIVDYKENEKLLHQKEVEHIISVEELRKEMLIEVSREESASPINSIQNGRSFESFPVAVQGSLVSNEVLPPWLEKHNASTAAQNEIGPSLKDYQKHLENAKKGKLPPQRVGADFNRNLPLSSSWLPSFGRVWNNGRRKASKREFQSSQRRQLHNGPKHFSRRDHHPTSSSVPPNINKYIL